MDGPVPTVGCLSVRDHDAGGRGHRKRFAWGDRNQPRETTAGLICGDAATWMRRAIVGVFAQRRGFWAFRGGPRGV